jgi:hypothetical protein
VARTLTHDTERRGRRGEELEVKRERNKEGKEKKKEVRERKREENKCSATVQSRGGLSHLGGSPWSP